MPLLYGEGENAFRRLLLAIMEHDNSHDLLLAGYGLDFKSDLRPEWLQGSLLPRSPAAYAGCVDIDLFDRDAQELYKRAAHYTTTNAGLLIDMPLVHFTGTKFVLAVLDYVQISSGGRLTLPLVLCNEPNEYAVARGLGVIDVPYSVTARAVVNQIYISMAAHTIPNKFAMKMRTHLDFSEAAKYKFAIISEFPTSDMSYYDAETDIFRFWPEESRILILAPKGAVENIAVLVKHPKRFSGDGDGVSTDSLCWFHTTQCSSAIEFLSFHTWSVPAPPKSPYKNDVRHVTFRGPSATRPPKRNIAWEEQIELTVATESGVGASEVSLRVSYSLEAPDRRICVMPNEPQQ